MKRDRVMLCKAEGMLMFRPLIYGDDLIRRERGLIVKLKRRQERGSPWHTPLLTVNFSLVWPLRITLVVAFA